MDSSEQTSEQLAQVAKMSRSYYQPPLHMFASRLGEFLKKHEDGKQLPEPTDRIETIENFIARLAYDSIDCWESIKILHNSLGQLHETLNVLKKEQNLSPEGKEIIQKVGERIASLEGQILVLRESRLSNSIENQIDLQKAMPSPQSWTDKISNFLKHPFILEPWKLICLAAFIVGLSFFTSQQAAIQQVQKMLPVSMPSLQHHYLMPTSLPKK